MFNRELIKLSARLSMEAYARADIDIGGTQLIIQRNNRHFDVVFRGTEKDRGDITTDLKFRMKDGAHRGFTDAYDLVHPALAEVIGDRRVRFHGHSLGGALAQKAALRFPNTICVITHGAPKVGDGRALGVPHLRRVHGNDIVPRVPYYIPWFAPYKHASDSTLDKFHSDISDERFEAHKVLGYQLP